ncbi:hypothetical protein [Streptomyces sp. NRRL F-5135]|uniref:hypothetical protein n=1 Tax=Streptomyces sp. NRRL F-5135 TaxID=1463858 RepID=UPI0004CA585F|nr:hypothetical protein [Streptomyces sp. NRRL F-5135]
MKASRYVRAAGGLGHLLLVVVLALGVFAMHSTGHPSDASGSTMSATSHASTTDAAETAHDPMGVPAVPGTGGRTTDPADRAVTPPPAMAMDMLSLCVAVLFAAWGLSALLTSAFARRQNWSASLLAGVAAVPRPDPPPCGPDLTRLSVLRL